MTDWIFYSASSKVPTVGEYLRGIPSRRNLRLERIFEDADESTVEAVRAAELLLGLHVALRLTNDPSGVVQLRVDEINPAGRAEYQAIVFPRQMKRPAAEQLMVRTELSLAERAVAAGHRELVDDALAGLEACFPGGVAHSPMNGALIEGCQMLHALDPEKRPWSHIDARYDVDPDYRTYLLHLFEKLPDGVKELMSPAEASISFAGRVRADVEGPALTEALKLLNYTGNYARGGYLRVREAGRWNEVAKFQSHVAALPPGWATTTQSKGGEDSGRISGMFSRWFGKS